MKLTEEELKQAANNRRFMRHLTASFWGFILVSVASILVWGKINQWINGEDEQVSATPLQIELLIHPEDQSFWEEKDPSVRLKKFVSKGVTQIWLPYSIQGTPFFSSKSIKYALDEEVNPVEYQWLKKAVFLKWVDAIEDSDVGLKLYYWANKTQQPFQAVADIKPQWFHPKSFIPALENDSSLKLHQALLDEARIKWSVKAFGLITHENDLGIEQFMAITNDQLTKRSNLDDLVLFNDDFVTLTMPSMSIIKWMEMSDEMRSQLVESSTHFLVYSKPPFTALDF